MIRNTIACSLILFVCVSLHAQPKAGIQNGPVTTINKLKVPLIKPLGKTRNYESQALYLKKDDWLVVMARTYSHSLSIDVFDRQSKKYIFSLEDTTKQELTANKYRTILTGQIPRTDSFDVLISVRKKESPYEDDEFSVPDTDTVFADFSIARLNSSWQPSDTNWGMLQRLNYLASHWTAGFRTVGTTYDEEKAAKDGKVKEYFPEIQIAVDPRLQCSIFPMQYGSELVYYMYSNDTTYAAAKALYDELSRKLKPITDYAKVSDLSSMRRIKELATTYFGIKIPTTKAPPDYGFLESAGKNQVYLPVSLFLFGDKQKARVLVVMGDEASDIYDIE